MGSEPNPLPYVIWNEVTAHTNSTVAPERGWMEKTIMGIQYGTIIWIFIFVIKASTILVKSHNNKAVQFQRRPALHLTDFDQPNFDWKKYDFAKSDDCISYQTLAKLRTTGLSISFIHI